MRRMLCLVLCLAMLAGCGGKKAPAETTASTPTATSSATTAADTTAATTPIPPRDPAYNVGEIRIGDVSITEYKIVLPEDPAEAEQYAAEELIKYIKLATGKTLEIAESADKAIYIGGYPDAAHIDDGFDIKVVDGDLIISGSIPRGTLYGVYTFLEEYIGWRWFDYDYEVVKVSDFIQIPIDLNDRQNPVYQIRASYWYNINNHPEYAAKMKNNRMTVSSPDYLGYMEGYTGGMCHTFITLVSPQKYFEEHPEWFTAHNDIRNGNYGQTQPCLTNPEVYEVVLASVREILEKNPDAKLVSVTQNDNGNVCTCENCMAVYHEEESHAGAMIRFVNAIAEDIEEDYPNVTIDTFAYTYTRKPPKLAKPRDNVQVRICSLECCFYHALDDDSCRNNRAFMKDFAGWSEICDNIAVWDYTANFHNYCAFFANFDAIYDNASTFAKNNVRGIMEQGNYQGISGEFGALKAYLLAKLNWDPYMTREEYEYHINDFLEGYYGPGWENIRYTIDLIQQRYGEFDSHMGIFNGTAYGGLSLEDVKEIEAGYAAAYELADETQKLHIEQASIAVMMAEWGYYQYNGMLDRTYKDKALEIFDRIIEKARALNVVHAESGRAW